MSAGTTEERLTALEKTVAEIKELLNQQGTKANWIEQISGSMKHIPKEDFDEMVRLGAEIRRADRPADEDKP